MTEKLNNDYDNIEEQAYPAMLITAGLNDPRVGYWEPAKWIALLRARRTNDAALYLRTNMGAGHGGQSGRYGRLEDMSYILSFTIDQLLRMYSWMLARIHHMA